MLPLELDLLASLIVRIRHCRMTAEDGKPPPPCRSIVAAEFVSIMQASRYEQLRLSDCGIKDQERSKRLKHLAAPD
jgi:hypothetical protein